jgi:hypothetical protein
MWLLIPAALGLLIAAAVLLLDVMWPRQRRRDDLGGRTEAGPK